MFEDSYQEHIAALAGSSKTEDKFEAPFDVNRNAAASWFRDNASTHLDEVMSKILAPRAAQTMPSDKQGMKPNADQEKFLRRFVQRLKVEVFDMQSRSVNTSDQEPLLDLVHGFP